MTSTYLKALILIALLTMLNACEEDSLESTNCDAFVFLDSEKYQNGATAFYTITSATITGDCLEVEYSSSGCSGESWTEELVDAEEILESFPIQRNLKMLLDNQEACAAVFSKKVSFDLTPLKTENYSKIVLNLEGLEESLIYEYGTDTTLEVQIQKKWDLENINGGLSGVNIDFPLGSITWSFSDKKVTIVNNNPMMNALYDGLESGVYDYAILESNNNKTLEVDGVNFGGVEIVNNELIIDNRAVDGFQFRYKSSMNQD